MYVSKGHTVTGKGQVKSAVKRASKRNARNVSLAKKTRITAPSAKMAKGY